MSALKKKKEEEIYLGTGRRKNSSARVRLTRGSGKIIINGRDLEVYCCTEQNQKNLVAPLKTVEMREQVDVVADVQGGGITGQAGAVALGIARALQKMDASLRLALKKDGHMKRDPRMKERKKAGLSGARKRFQFSKR